jgi:hypothetical protein
MFFNEKQVEGNNQEKDQALHARQVNTKKDRNVT